MHGSKYGNWALNKADLIIAVGTRFDDRVTGKVSAFAPGAQVIHFDIDAAEVGKIRHAEIPVVGPLRSRSRSSREVQALAATPATRVAARSSRSGASSTRTSTGAPTGSA
jgi:acetolactate synthase-1/2/3 large subunit